MVSGGVNLFGKTCVGLKMHSSYQHTLITFAGSVHKENRDVDQLTKLIPLPGEWTFVADRNQLQVQVSEIDAPRYQTAYGYVGPSISATASVGTSTPSLLQIVVQLDFKYGSSIFETDHSYIFVRINAYCSRACANGDFA